MQNTVKWYFMLCLKIEKFQLMRKLHGWIAINAFFDFRF